MTVRVQTLETVPLLVAFVAEKEIVAILAHPAVTQDLLLTVETLYLLVVVELWLENDLELMSRAMCLQGVGVLLSRAFEKAFLTCINSYLHSL